MSMRAKKLQRNLQFQGLSSIIHLKFLQLFRVVDKSNFREMRDILTLKHGSKQKIRALEAKMSSAISKVSG